jgi:hypothetical protein
LTAGALAYTVSLSPLLSVRYLDFKNMLETDIKATRALLDISKSDKESQARFAKQYNQLINMPLKQYIENYFEKKNGPMGNEVGGLLSNEDMGRGAENRKAPVTIIKVEGMEWKKFFEKVISVSRGLNVDRAWERRFPNEKHHLKDLFFKVEEQPLSSIASSVKDAKEKTFLSLDLDNEPQYLEIKYHEYSDADFTIFGFLPSPKPPSYLFYPYRQWALGLLVAGVALYIFLPRARKEKGAIKYPFGAVLLGDAAACVQTIPFFIIPAVIVEGFRQAFFEAWPLVAVFWLVGCVGLYLFKIVAWYAAYQLMVLKDRIRISTYKGTTEYPYTEMSFFQPVVFTPPRWLTVLMWLAALANKGGARIAGLGRAFQLGSSAYSSIGIRLKNGSTLFLNMTNALGGLVFKEAEGIVQTLKEAGVEEKSEVKVIRSLGLETIRLPNS